MRRAGARPAERAANSISLLASWRGERHQPTVSAMCISLA